MINSYLNIEQENREKQGLEARDNEAGLETDMYSAGFFDGLIGLEPSKPERHSYWAGYAVGYREYWAKELGVEIPTEF
ncbi:MAG: hypothetical protein ACRC1Z_06010 [Waterburya sp.]